MSDAQYAEFGHRIKRIDRHHRKLAKGYVTTMNHDGLVVARPRRASSGLPMRGLFLALVALLVFKSFMLAQLGVEGYNAQMALLADGSTFERVTAYAMMPDPITQWLSVQIGNIF
ncbi:MAG: hypothetical protein ACU0CA_04720 [Paracoccaceae bacterium]